MDGVQDAIVLVVHPWYVAPARGDHAPRRSANSTGGREGEGSALSRSAEHDRPAAMPKDGKKAKDDRVINHLRLRPFSAAIATNIQKVGKIEGVNLQFE